MLSSSNSDSSPSLLDEMITGIVNANKFLLISINRLMDYTKVTEGMKLVPKQDVCSIEESMKTVLLCLSSSKDKDLIKLSPLPSILSMSPIITDQQWLQENILCLLSNAVKFVPKRNGEIVIRFDLITNDEMESNSKSLKKSKTKDKVPETMILVEVEDNGIGIPHDLQSKLFAPFQQAHKNNGGTGLGLYSLAQRVAALGGKCGVDDRHDGRQGALFWFTLPYHPALPTVDSLDESDALSNEKMKEHHQRVASLEVHDFDSSHHHDQELHLASASGDNDSDSQSLVFASVAPAPATLSSTQKVAKKLRLLIADDSSTIRNILTKSLQRVGHEVVAVTNGLEAVQIIEESLSNHDVDPIFDAVILDLHMPILDGFDTIRRIRSMERSQQNASIMESDDDTFSLSILTTAVNDVSPSFKTRITPGKSQYSSLFIIGCSANDDSDTVHDVISAGANAFIVKPFTVNDLENMIFSHNNQHR